MRVLFWVPYPTEGASNRYRVEQYLPYIEKEGIEYSLRPFWNSSAFKILYERKKHFRKFLYFIRGTVSRIFDILQIYRFDIVFIHREAFPVGGPFFENLLSQLKKPFIFDFDDAIFLHSFSSSNHFYSRFKNSRKIETIIRKSAHVIAGNAYLARFASSLSQSVSILPTPINTEKYLPIKKKEHKKLVIIGWIGSQTTMVFLNMMKEIFDKLFERYPEVVVKVVGSEKLLNGNPKIISKTWKIYEELEDLQTFDIGIMPMPEDEWTNGKCGFKAIMYMSMGIPSVVSDVGMNKEIIVDGQNGYLAKDYNEWFEKLSTLIENIELREKIGMAGRKTIERKYSVAIIAPKLINILKKVYLQTGGI